MPTILIIDDNLTLVANLVEQLGESGYTVLHTGEAAVGEQLAQTNQPDLIVLEPAIERGHGWVLIERLSPLFPVLVLSSQGLEEDVVRGLEAGAVDYLTKPFRSAELAARIRMRLRPPTEPQTPVPPQAVTDTTSHLAPVDSPPPVPPTQRKRSRPSDMLGEDGEPAFIPMGEEQQMLREAEQAEADAVRQEDLAHLPLGERLRAARQRKRITLVQAELETRLRMHYIQAMEEEKFSLLPGGPAAEDLLRRYAEYLKVDVNQAIEEYRHLHYTEPLKPPTALGGVQPPRQVPAWLIWGLAVALALLLGIGGIRLLDPGFFDSLDDRAWALVNPPTATPTATLTPIPTSTSTPLPTPTPSATATPSAPPSPTRTATPTVTGTPGMATPTSRTVTPTRTP